MTRLLWCLLLIAALFLVPCGQAAAADAPRIMFDQMEKTFTNVKEGQQLDAVFKFKNTGKMNLIIDEVSPSCGCTVAKFDKVTEPGKSGAVRLTLDTTGINGAFRKTAVVATNDPSNPFLTLVMSGETASRVVVEGGRRVDVIGCLGKDVSTTVTLKAPDGGHLIIAGVQNPMSDYLQAKLEAVPGGKKYKLHLKAIATYPVEFAGPVFLIMPGQPKVSVFVVVEVRGPFTARPHEIYFGAIDKKGPVPTRTILLEKACADTLSIDNLEYNANLLNIKQSWTKAGTQLLLTVSPRLENLIPGKLEENIAITSHGLTFKILVRGAVK